MRAMYNRVHRAQNKRLVLKSYITGIITLILPKRNELHSWVKNYPRVIHTSNVKHWSFFKVNGTRVMKQKYILQITVPELHNDMMLPISEGGFFGVRTVDGKLCI